MIKKILPHGFSEPCLTRGTKDQLSGGSGGAAATAGSHVNWSRCPGCGHLILALADHPHAAHDPYHDVGEDDVAEIARDHETVPQLLPSKTPSNPNSTSALSNTKTSITPHWSSTSPRFSTISFRIPVPCDQCNKTSKNSKNLNYVPCCINSELVTEADVNCGSDKTRSILEEVLSWRRTFSEGHETHKSSHSLKLRPKPSLHHSIAPNCLSLKYIFLILSLVLSSSVSCSESPDRECCDGPVFKPDPVPGQHYPSYNFPPPEVPDFPEYGPHEVPPRVPGYGPGVYSTGTSGSLGCLLARTLCLEDSACNQILQVIPRVCGLELVTCSTPTVTKCQAALRTLQSFPFFKPTCLCKEPRLDPDCNQFKEFLVDHPCLNAKYKENDPYPVDALPTCDHAQEVCQRDKVCSKKIDSFQKHCPVKNDQCVMTDVPSCHGSWQTLRQSPIFGCICPNNMSNKKNCDKIFKSVNANDCIDAQLPDSLRVVQTNLARASQFWTFWYQNLNSGGYSRTTRHTVSVDETTTPYFLPTMVDRERGESSLQDQEIFNLRSTCHIALDRCERDSNCRPYLEPMKSRCVDSCNSRERCMSAVREFYRKIPKQHSLDIAFCLCKKNGADDQCLRAQTILHPPCAQTPSQWSGREEDLPSCHQLARNCRKDDRGCRQSLERYEQTCSADADTKTCAAPYPQCRDAMVEILGTDLRTNCACTGTAGDFRELFECIEYQRLFWVNPCVVDAQKDYHVKSDSTPQWTPGPTQPPRRDPPNRKTNPPRRKTDPPRRQPDPPRKTTPRSRYPVTSQPVTTRSTEERAPPREPATQSRYVPVATTPWTAPTPPVRTPPPRRRPKPTQPPPPEPPPGANQATPPPPMKGAPVTTLPPSYCSLTYPNFTDGNVKYIREGFEKRLYDEDPTKSGSRLCGCNSGPELKCTWLEEIEKKPCNTESAFYSHASPFYLAYRGQCLCYSGEFICAKHDTAKGSKKGGAKVQVADAPPGVYIYLGYSKKDALILQRGRVKLGKKVPDTEEEERNEVKNTIQQTVSHFTSNANKSDCRINMVDRIGENYILKATMDEFDEYRMKKNMSDEMKYREKVECFAALESIAHKINERDADMRSHIVLSMFKVAAAEANVPEPPASGAKSHLFDPPTNLLLFFTLFVSLNIQRFFSDTCSVSSIYL